MNEDFSKDKPDRDRNTKQIPETNKKKSEYDRQHRERNKDRINGTAAVGITISNELLQKVNGNRVDINSSQFGVSAIGSNSKDLN